jgi:PAS domain S-box-containing protein
LGDLKENRTRSLLLRRLRGYFKNLVPLFQLAPIEETFYRELQANQDELAMDQYYGFIVIALMPVIASIAVFLIFSRKVVRRIHLMMENYVRLATDKPLLPIMKGDDEIVTLDHDFHSMADELQTVLEKQRATTENVSDVIFSLDPRGRFLAVNPASERIFGYQPDELIGNKLINLCSATAGEDVLNALKIISDGGYEPPFEMPLIRKDGRVIDVSCSATWSDKERSIFCVARDMTERKQAERLRKEVMQMVSHDLKTPLATVRSFFEMLDAGMFGELSQRGQKLLKLADNSTGRMLTLVKDLLDIEKMEAGMLQLQRSDVLLAEIFEQAAGSVNSQAAQFGVTVEVVPCQLQTNSDPDRVVQILVNLLTNAIKFSPRGERVLISAQQKDDFVEVRVTDHGRGIPEDKIAAIFDRFSQVKVSDATEKGGSGLGLAICKALVQLHGGKIHVESEENKGSAFVFALPLAQSSGGLQEISLDTEVKELAS